MVEFGKKLERKYKMEKEFNLSEKICYGMKGFVKGALCEDDIKEFIKRDLNLMERVMANEITFQELWILRNRLLGEKFRS